MELYKEYRPVSFKQVVGQDGVVATLRRMIKAGKVPHTLLFSGPSGCGKTTLARIMRKPLRCKPGDFYEVNSANDRGIDFVRQIQQRVRRKPLSGGQSRVWVIDEAHQLTKPAQEAMLKVLEDTPDHVYFMLCTTEPLKLIKAVRTRATELKCKAVANAPLAALVARVVAEEWEGGGLAPEVLAAIVDAADGSPRQALVSAQIAMQHPDDPDEACAAVQALSGKGEAYKICVALQRGSWGEAAKAIRDAQITNDEAEGVRMLVLAWFTTTLVGKPAKDGKPAKEASSGKTAKRAAVILEAFSEPFYNSGRAGLALAAYTSFFGADG